MSISVSGYLGQDIFRPLPTIPSEKNRWCFEIFIILHFHPENLGEDEPNLTIIFFRWGGGKFNHQNDPKPCEKKPPCHAVNQPEKRTPDKFAESQATTGRMSMMTWKQVVDPEMMVCNYLEFVEEVDLGVS